MTGPTDDSFIMSLKYIKCTFTVCLLAGFVLLLFGVISMKPALVANFRQTFHNSRSLKLLYLKHQTLQNISSLDNEAKSSLIKLLLDKTRSEILNILSIPNRTNTRKNTTLVTTTTRTTTTQTTTTRTTTTRATKHITSINTYKTSISKNTSLQHKPFLVPNVVHYIFLSPKKVLRFHEMLGVLSTSMFIKPEVIKIHCDVEPDGVWWKFIKGRVKNLKMVPIKQTVNVFGIVPDLPETKSDVLRLMILKKEGGIYLDFDVIAIRTFDELRKNEFTMGIEYHGSPGRLNNGIIISAPEARFLNIWLNTYNTFKHDEWDEHSCQVPYQLRLKYPNLINVKEKTLNYPSGLRIDLIYFSLYDWRKNYAMHLWYRMYLMNKKFVDLNPKSIRTMNTTFGQLARRVFYNTTEFVN